MKFEGITRLWRTVSPLRTARWLVGENADAFKFVARNFVSNSLQRTGVERAGNAVAPVRPAVQKRFEMHRGDRAVMLHPGLDVHQYRMAAAMTIENFFARQRAFHRPAGNHRQLADDNLVIEGIAFAAKAAAVRRRDHSDVTRRYFQNFRERAMDVMRRLGRAPKSQLLVRIIVCNRRMLFH